MQDNEIDNITKENNGIARLLRKPKTRNLDCLGGCKFWKNSPEVFLPQILHNFPHLLFTFVHLLLLPNVLLFRFYFAVCSFEFSNCLSVGGSKRRDKAELLPFVSCSLPTLCRAMNCLENKYSVSSLIWRKAFGQCASVTLPKPMSHISKSVVILLCICLTALHQISTHFLLHLVYVAILQFLLLFAFVYVF